MCETAARGTPRGEKNRGLQASAEANDGDLQECMTEVPRQRMTCFSFFTGVGPSRLGVDEAERAGGWRGGGVGSELIRCTCVRHLMPFVQASSFSLALRDLEICSTR